MKPSTLLTVSLTALAICLGLALGSLPLRGETIITNGNHNLSFEELRPRFISNSNGVCCISVMYTPKYSSNLVWRLSDCNGVITYQTNSYNGPVYVFGFTNACGFVAVKEI